RYGDGAGAADDVAQRHRNPHGRLSAGHIRLRLRGLSRPAKPRRAYRGSRAGLAGYARASGDRRCSAMTAPLQTRRDGPLTELVLNRPDKANALNAELIEAMLEAVEAAASDGTRLLVLRGEGKVFCGGFDFSGLDSQSEGDLVLRFI